MVPQFLPLFCSYLHWLHSCSFCANPTFLKCKCVWEHNLKLEFFQFDLDQTYFYFDFEVQNQRFEKHLHLIHQDHLKHMSLHCLRSVMFIKLTVQLGMPDIIAHLRVIEISRLIVKETFCPFQVEHRIRYFLYYLCGTSKSFPYSACRDMEFAINWYQEHLQPEK